MPRTIENLFVQGPVGRIEAILEEPEDAEPLAAVLVCHAHPQHGGTMHTKAVHRLARGLRRAGAVVMRFHYRGVHLSEGSYDHGVGEIEDGRAALEFLRARYPHLPYALAGFSFGSRIALKLALNYPKAEKVIAVGYPTKYPDPEYIAQIAIPRVFLQSTNDEFGPVDELNALLARLGSGITVRYVESRDHFFADALDAYEAAVTEIGPLRR
ncbi:MAG: alpha/beta family hydrolase [Bryobacter sp.]|nr:alpha/beta family hydrolase [Bryobacter sp.]